MNRLEEFQRATGTAQLDHKARDSVQLGGNVLFEPFQKSAAMEAGEAGGAKDATPVTAEDAQMEMPRFFAQVKEVKEANKRVLVLTEEIERQHKEALSTAQSTASETIEALMAKVNQLTNRTRRILQEMEQVTRQLATTSPPGSGNLRMRESHHRQLAQAFMDAMRRYQKMQETAQDRYRAQLRRQYLIVRPNATGAELEELTRDPEALKVQVFAVGVREESRKTLQQMRSRLQDMENIERSIMELNQMFVEMQDLVLAQGEMVTRIGYNVDHIEDYTAQAAKNMESAVASQQAIQRKKWYIALAIVIVAVIVLLMIALSVFRTIFPFIFLFGR